MSTSSRSLDDLDRLAFRLSRLVRQQFPQLERQGFTLIDLEERLLPFRETRREMADGGADAWERAMLRLMSGERDILEVDDDVRAACRQALALPSPTLALIRSWSTSLLRLRASQPGGEQPATNALLDDISAKKPRTAPGCRYCGGRLPDGRQITFCPHCGLDLTKRECPACSTELDAGWRFCVTCGRGAEAADSPALVRIAS